MTPPPSIAFSSIGFTIRTARCFGCRLIRFVFLFRFQQSFVPELVPVFEAQVHFRQGTHWVHLGMYSIFFLFEKKKLGMAGCGSSMTGHGSGTGFP